jgi:aspartate kinase
MLIVQKYGGSSLADAARIRRAAGRIAALANQGHKIVAVVSAQGDTTDLLLQRLSDLTETPDPRELDAYLAAGEQLSAAMMAMTLQDMGVPAVSLTGWQAGLVSDDRHTDARVLGLRNDRLRRTLDAGKVAVVAGFQAANAEGDITTLGRGGSDTTAVALAAYLQADKCMIYTDVDGVYDKDPRLYPDAVRFDTISYDDMLALARQGAQVLHDRCVEFGKRYGVKIQVLSSFRPGEGTLVGNFD